MQHLTEKEIKHQCNDCLTIFTGLSDFKVCPECEGSMHEIINASYWNMADNLEPQGKIYGLNISDKKE